MTASGIDTSFFKPQCEIDIRVRSVW